MKKKTKFGLLALGLLAATVTLSGCTANFCTNDEKGKIAFALDFGVTQYYHEDELASLTLGENDVKEAVATGSKIYRVIQLTGDNSYAYAAKLNGILSSAKSNGIGVPNTQYFEMLDKKVFDKAVSESGLNLLDANINVKDVYNVLYEMGGAIKYNNGGSDVFACYKAFNNEIRSESYSEGYSVMCPVDFENFYVSQMGALIDTYRSCITTNAEYKYGNYGVDRFGNPINVSYNQVTWGDAWSKGGRLIEGLIVYPVAWMIDGFAKLFAQGSGDIQAAYLQGYPQLLSLILVTVIVRLFIFLVTIKSTLSQKKMTELQPELAKIQQKYPNSNTSQVQKQRLAEEQMRLYKKHKVNPLSQLLVLVVQFPVFIGVWGAMTGSAVLSTGTVLGLDLSQSIWECLKQGPAVAAGWWPALVLIILMSASQFFSMKVPQWIQKAKTKKVASLSKNPAQKQQNRTANIVSYVMLVMIIVMGFTLPAAMGVYWFIGALVSLLQTFITNAITGKKKHSK